MSLSVVAGSGDEASAQAGSDSRREHHSGVRLPTDELEQAGDELRQSAQQKGVSVGALKQQARRVRQLLTTVNSAENIRTHASTVPTKSPCDE